MRLPLRNKLAYPSASAAGFDPTHIAAVNCRYSGVAMNNRSLTSLLDGVRGTIGSNVNAATDGNIGPVITSVSAPGGVTYTGRNTAADTSFTFGAVFRKNSGSNFAAISTSSTPNSGTGGILWGSTGGGILAQVSSGSFITPLSGIMVTGLPYFIASSINASTSNHLILNLATGQLFTATAGGLTATAPDGTYIVGSEQLGSTSGNNLAAVMVSAEFLGMSQLLFWAKNPWSFWFPENRVFDFLVGTPAAVAPFVPWITRAPIALGW